MVGPATAGSHLPGTPIPETDPDVTQFSTMIAALSGQYQAIAAAAGTPTATELDMTVVFDAGQNSADNFAARLFIDEQTHLPLMVTYKGPQPRMMSTGAGARQVTPAGSGGGHTITMNASMTGAL